MKDDIESCISRWKKCESENKALCLAIATQMEGANNAITNLNKWLSMDFRLLKLSFFSHLTAWVILFFALAFPLAFINDVLHAKGISIPKTYEGGFLIVLALLLVALWIAGDVMSDREANIEEAIERVDDLISTITLWKERFFSSEENLPAVVQRETATLALEVLVLQAPTDDYSVLVAKQQITRSEKVLKKLLSEQLELAHQLKLVADTKVDDVFCEARKRFAELHTATT